ncbi:unnamed protein product [Sphacelaria rigidula]
MYCCEHTTLLQEKKLTQNDNKKNQVGANHQTHSPSHTRNNLRPLLIDWKKFSPRTALSNLSSRIIAGIRALADLASSRRFALCFTRILAHLFRLFVPPTLLLTGS